MVFLFNFFIFVFFFQYFATVWKSISLLFSYSNFGISRQNCSFVSPFQRLHCCYNFQSKHTDKFQFFSYTSLLIVFVVKNFKSKRNNKTENDESREMVKFWSISTFDNAFRFFLNILTSRFFLRLLSLFLRTV